MDSEIVALAERIEVMQRNFAYIRGRSNHLPQLSVCRGIELVARMCEAEYKDYINRNQKLKTDDVLGKRKEKHIFNMVKEIDGKKLKTEEAASGAMVEGEFSLWPEEKQRLLLECIGDDLEKLKRILKIHQAKTKVIQEEEKKSAGVMSQIEDELRMEPKKTIYQHEVNLIEVTIYSKLSMEDKFTFLWDLLSEEFDKETEEGRYDEFLDLILDLLKNWEDIKTKNMRPWEYFMRQLPRVDKKLLDHIFHITKDDKNSILLYEVVQYSSKEMKVEGINYMLKSGICK